MKRLKDDNGEWVQAEDRIHFTYGIPPTFVTANVFEKDSTLFIECDQDVTPRVTKLRSLRSHVGSWYKEQVNNQWLISKWK